MPQIMGAVGWIVASLGGGAVIVLGLSAYIGRLWANWLMESIKRDYDAEFERLRSDIERQTRRLQAVLDARTHVTRVQYETEFTLLKDLWPKIVALANAVRGIRPEMDIGPREETDEQRRRRLFERIQRAQEALAAAWEAVHGAAPFYEEEVFQALKSIVDASQLEIIDVSTDDQPFGREWWGAGERHIRALNDAFEDASTRIRRRLQNLAIVE